MWMAALLVVAPAWTVTVTVWKTTLAAYVRKTRVSWHHRTALIDEILTLQEAAFWTGWGRNIFGRASARSEVKAKVMKAT